MSEHDAKSTKPRSQAVIPGATYRLQLNSTFRFADAEHIVPYLSRLGVTHLYLSPYLKARPGSAHGYDVIDHTSLNDEIGSRADLESLARRLREADMGQIVDVVPNHMGVMGSDSAWWLDVLENGQSSRYAGYFDIDWQPVRPELRNKVLVPVLGDHYGAALERGELKLVFTAETGEFAIHYFDHKLPLDPASYDDVLSPGSDDLAAELGEDSPELAEYLSILRAVEQLPGHWETDEARREERLREKEVIKRRLAGLCASCRAVRERVDKNVETVGGAAEAPTRSFARLHGLLERQAWRVAYWQVAADDINYRRFFDINELAALRMDQPGLLPATHGLIVELYRDGLIDGLRIDHPDGLYDPAAYFAALQALLAGSEDAGPPSAETPTRCYIVAEKILATHEHLREDWAVHGTTGYEYAALADGLTICSESERTTDRSYRSYTQDRLPYDEMLYGCKKLIIRLHLSSELTMLANLLNQIALADWKTRDFTLSGLRDALTEIVACFPVYRTYVSPRSIGADDRKYVEWAVAWAKRRDPRANPEIYELIQRLLLLDWTAGFTAEQRSLCERFAMTFQQYTAPVMAKALEDTCFYRYVRLLSLCEVGADPSRFGVSIAAFHHHNRERQRRWPHSLLAGSTHDSKRSQDVRARLNVLSERPDDWRTRVRRWRQLTRSLRRRIGDADAPSRRDQYAYFQSVLGLWPLRPPDAAELESLTERLVAYMRKAAREAKLDTSWMRPNEDYEDALEHFIRASLNPSEDNLFRADVAEFAREIAVYGLLNSLTLTALRMTAPGVPDIYQGDEIWDFNLVDPDNRRPVDYVRRMELLEALVERAAPEHGPLAGLVDELMSSIEDGRIKLYLIWRLLHLRRAQRQLFDHGEYLALSVTGTRAEQICAFLRRHGDEIVLVVAGRRYAGLPLAPDGRLPAADAWSDTWVELPDPVGPLHNGLTGESVQCADNRLAVAEVLARLPVAVLHGRIEI